MKQWWGVVLMAAAGACTPAVGSDAGSDAGGDAGGDSASDGGGLKDADFGDAMREAIALRAVVGLGNPRPGCAACAYRLESDRGEIIDGRTSSDGTIEMAIPFDRTWSATVVSTAGGATSLVGIDRPVRGEILVASTQPYTAAATTPAQTVNVRFHGAVPGLNATGVRFEAMFGSGNNMRSLAVVDGATTDFSVGANANLSGLMFSATVFGTETAGGGFVGRTRYFDAVDGRSGVDVDLSQFVAQVATDSIAIPTAPSGLFANPIEWRADAGAPPGSIWGGVLRRIDGESSLRVGDCVADPNSATPAARCVAVTAPATAVDREVTVTFGSLGAMNFTFAQRASEPAPPALPVVSAMSYASFTRTDLQMRSDGDPSLYRSIAIGSTYNSDIFGEAEWRIFAFRPGHEGTLKVPTLPAPYQLGLLGTNMPCCWRGAQLSLTRSRDETPPWSPDFVHGHLSARVGTRANPLPL